MIQKCPHCKTDVIFSRDICPACGHPSRDEERGEPTYLGEAKTDGRPVYNQEMEATMTARQRHGRILVGMICGAIPAPLLAHTVTYLVWLKVNGWVLLGLFVSCTFVYHLWYGRKWAHWLAAAGTLVAGCAGLYQAVLRRGVGLNAVEIMAYVVFALVYLWCAWQLIRCQDVKEFLLYQRKHTPEY
jgi:hypothetical protein